MYECRLNEGYVVKIDKGGRFANVSEWQMWQHVSKHKKEISKYFAPCIEISKCGLVLIQKKTSPLLFDTVLELPSFMWDLSKKNFGLLDGLVVCHDYSNHIMYKKLNTELITIQIN